MGKNSKLDKIYTYLEKDKVYKDRKKVLDFIENGYETLSNFDDEMIYEILIIIIGKNFPFDEYIENAKEVYKNMVININGTDELKELFLKLYKNLFVQNNMNKENFNCNEMEAICNIINIFEDKKLSLSLINIIFKKTKDIEDRLLIDKISDYLSIANMYYVDENQLYSSAVKLYMDLQNRPKNEWENVITDTLKKDRRLSGINDINEDLLETISNKIENIKNQINELNISDDELIHLNYDEINYITSLRNSINMNQKQKYKLQKNFLSELKSYLQELSINNPTDINTCLFKIKMYQLILNKEKIIEKIITLSKHRVNEYINDWVDGVNIEDIDTKFTNIKYKEFLDRILTEDEKSLDDGDLKLQEIIIKALFDLEELEKENHLEENEYLKDKIMRIFGICYYAIYNENMWILKELIKNYDIDDIDYDLVDIKITSKFPDKHAYLKMILKLFNKDCLSDLTDYLNMEESYILYMCYHINENFCLEKSIFNIFGLGNYARKNILVEETFGIDVVANLTEESNPNLYNSLVVLSKNSYVDRFEEEIQILKKLFDKDPKFILYNCTIIHNFKVLNTIFSLDEIAGFIMEQQNRCEIIEKYYDGYGYKNIRMFIFNPNIFNYKKKIDLEKIKYLIEHNYYSLNDLLGLDDSQIQSLLFIESENNQKVKKNRK